MSRNLFFILMSLFSLLGHSQSVSFANLQTFCESKTWQKTNESLVSTNWEFFDSSPETDDKYSRISWSFKRNRNNDKAQAWLAVFSFQEVPSKVTYDVFDKQEYLKIFNQIRNAGYVLENTEVKTESIETTYKGAKFIVIINTDKRNADQDDYYDKGVITGYRFTLIKRSSIYDPDNGIKNEYWENGNLKDTYTLVNGKLQGENRMFHKNGKLSAILNFKDDRKDGKISYFDEDGSLIRDGFMKAGLGNGTFKEFENGKITAEYEVKNDLRNGKYKEYVYNKENTLFGFQNGFYENDERIGKWTFEVLENSKPRELIIKNYINGLLSGEFQDVSGDTLIIANYKNNKLSGHFKSYVDLKRMVFGGLISTNLEDLILIEEGNYENDYKEGLWKEYHLSNNLKATGNYTLNKKNGLWKYYFAKTTEGQVETDYSQKLYLTENYLDGNLHGLLEIFMIKKSEDYQCATKDITTENLGICTKSILIKDRASIEYLNGKKNGKFDYYSEDGLSERHGFFKDDKETGEWIIINGTKPDYFKSKGHFKNGEKDGVWEISNGYGQMVDKSTFKNGMLNGESIEYNLDSANAENRKSYFTNDKIYRVEFYDDSQISELFKIEKHLTYVSFTANFKDKTTLSYHFKTLLVEDSDLVNQLYDLLKTGYDLNIPALVKSGIYTVKDEEGKLLIDGGYKDNFKTYSWVYYFYDEGVKMTRINDSSPFNDTFTDLKTGEMLNKGEIRFVNVEEGIIEEIKIRNGKRNGRTDFLDIKTGKFIRKLKFDEGVLKD